MPNNWKNPDAVIMATGTRIAKSAIAATIFHQVDGPLRPAAHGEHPADRRPIPFELLDSAKALGRDGALNHQIAGEAPRVVGLSLQIKTPIIDPAGRIGVGIVAVHGFEGVDPRHGLTEEW